MAGKTIGSALEIPQSALDSIKKAEDRLKGVQDAATNTAASVNASFKSMALNTDQFIAKLDEIINKMNLVSSAAANANSATSGFGQQNVGGIQNFNTAISQAIANINKMAASLQTGGSTGASGVMIARQAVQDLITAMKNTSGLNIAHLKEEIKNINSELTDTTANLTKKEQDALNQRKKLLQDELKEQERTQNERAQNYAKMIDRMLAAEQSFQNKQKKAYSTNAKSYQSQNYALNTTYSGALSFSDSANTLNRQQKAIEYLTAAKMKLSTADADYKKKLDALNAAIEKHKTALREAGDNSRTLAEQHSYLAKYTTQLAQRMAVLFTFNAAKNFINQIAEVRGEFEMSQRSLEAILGNKTEADRIFNKTVALAVKSPFQIKDLVSYTRQLAAYRIESDELYDTTKRLADVSAGLGVDMQRLILAYGQVKAAAYLRGSEVRQFTEAGVNMYGELQAYFKEVKGEAYTTAQIVDMISRRQVTFEDVSEVLKRMTNEGGIFYNMQEQQAETLQGKIANLKDSYDVMYNAIGTEHEGALKGTISLVTTMLDNWEAVANVVKSVTAVVFSMYASSKMLSGAWGKTAQHIMLSFNSMRQMNAVRKTVFSLSGAMDSLTTAAGKAWNAFAASMPLLAISAVIAAVTELIGRIMDYNDAVRKSTGEYFTARVRVRDIDDKSKTDIKGALNDLVAEMNKIGFEVKIKTSLTEDEARVRYNKLLGEYETYLEERRQLEVRFAANNAKGTWFDESAQTDFKDLDKAAGDFLSAGDNIRAKLLELSEASDKFTESQRAVFAELAKGKKDGEEAIDYYQRIYNAVRNFGVLGDMFGFMNSAGQYADAYKEAKREAESLFGTLDKERTAAEKKRLEIHINDAVARGEISEFVAEIIRKEAHINVAVNEEGATKAMRTLLDDLQTAADARKIKINVKLDMTGAGSFSDAVDDVAKDAKAWKKDIEALQKSKMKYFDASLFGINSTIDFNGQKINGNTVMNKKAALNYLQMRYKQAMQLSDLAGGDPFAKENARSAKANQKKQRDILNERISLLKEMEKRYESLSKLAGKDAAIKAVMAEYKDSLAYVGMPDDIAKSFVPDKKGLADALEKLLPTINDFKKKSSVLNDINELKLKVNEEEVKKQLDDLGKYVETLFDGRELHIKLKDIGLGESEIQTMFGRLPNNFADIRKSIEEKYTSAYGSEKSSWGSSITEQYEKEIKKLNEAQYKDQVSQLQDLTKAYASQLSEQLQLDKWYFEERSKIQNNGSLQKTPDLQKQYQENLDRQYKNKTDENTWKSFTGSDFYIDTFDSLESTSARVLAAMQTRLRNLRNELKNLSPEQLKTVMEQSQKIDEQLTLKNPFASLVSGLKNYVKFAIQRKALEREYLINLSKQEALSKQVSSKGNDVNTAKTEYDAMAEKYGLDSQEAQQAKITYELRKAELDVLLKQQVALGKFTAEQAETIRNGQQSQNTSKTALNGVIDYTQQISEGWSEISSMLEKFGVEVPSWIGEAISGVSQIEGGISGILDGKLISGTLGVVSGLGNTIASVFGLGSKDNKLQEQIERQQKRVEALQRAYEKLKSAIDDAYDSSSLIAYNNQAEQNIKAQIASYEAMIKAENSKKKTDKDKITEYQNAIDDLKTSLKELAETETEAFGGFGSDANYKAAAEAFTEAWVDAFNEGEDTLDALQDKFDDYFNNMLKKQLTNRAASKFITPILEAFDKAVSEGSEGGNGGTDVTANELAKLQRLKEENLAAYDAYLKSLTEILGATPADSTSSNMSGLQKGIQSVTESTAEALESILNSVRYYLAMQQADVAVIKNLLSLHFGGTTTSADANPQTILLREQCAYLSRICGFWESAIKGGHSKGGMGLKVFID